MPKKNVDYAAYEYNVYVRCNYNGRKQKVTRQRKKQRGVAGRDLITYDNQYVKVNKGKDCPDLSTLLALRKKRI
jgi:hypothetical protein